MSSQRILATLVALAALAITPAIVHAQVFTDGDFPASNYDVFLGANNGDEDVRFAFDYGSYDVFGDGFITGTIPEAPNSSGGAATTGVFLSVNNDSATTSATEPLFAAIFPKLSMLNSGQGVGTGTPTPNFRVKLDVFGSTGAGVLDSVNGVLGDGDDDLNQSGTTNKVHVGINHADPAVVGLQALSLNMFDADGDGTQDGNGIDLSQAGATAGQGMGLGFSPDQGATEDYYAVYGGFQYTYRGGRPRSVLDATATTTGRATDFINEFWDATPDFELVDTDADDTNNLTVFTGNELFFSPDPANPSSFDGLDSGSGVRYYFDNFPLPTGAPHYTVSDLTLDGFGANSRLLDNDEDRPLDFPENNDEDPENDVTRGIPGGTPFNSWSEHEILFSDEIMTYSIDGHIIVQMAAADAADAVSTAGTIMLAYYDRFTSIADSPEGANFVVYDNLVIEAAGTGETPDLLQHLIDDGFLPNPNPEVVDGDDLITVQRTDPSGTLGWEQTYGTVAGSAAAAPIPEPSSAVLLMGLVSGAAIRRRR